MARLNGLLGHGGNNTGALRVACLVFDGPLATEDALVFFPLREEVHIAVVTPAVAMVNHESDKLFIVFRGFVKIVLVHSYALDRYLIPACNTSTLSFAFPIIVLHDWHNKPRTFPVAWQ